MRERRRSAGKLRARLAARIAAWDQKRKGCDRTPFEIAARRVYILPTRAGFAFAALLFVMLIAAMNYANSMALMITFVLAGFALIGMHLTHRNLVGITLRGVSTSDGFAGDHGRVLVTLENGADAPRLGLRCEIAGAAGATVDLPAAATARADLSLPLQLRGRHRVERIKLSTAFPFGLFRAWTWLHLPLTVLAWPAPRGRQDPPPQAASGAQTPALHRAGDEEWAGLRAFRSGDSPRQVAWSLYARGRGLLVKTYESPAAQHHLFDLAAAAGGDIEQRLEQLSAWVVAAHERGDSYGLRLAAEQIEPAAGNEHRARCLSALALFGS